MLLVGMLGSPVPLFPPFILENVRGKISSKSMQAAHAAHVCRAEAAS
jgi:hypothetical protein